MEKLTITALPDEHRQWFWGRRCEPMPSEPIYTVTFPCDWAPMRELFDIVNGWYISNSRLPGVYTGNGNTGSATILATAQGLENLSKLYDMGDVT